MDLAVLLPLAVLLALQSVIGVCLLLPRAVSKPVASLIAAASTNAGAYSAVLTAAGAVAAMTVSAAIQLAGVMRTLQKGSAFGDRALALTVEELRALLALVLGASNLVTLFLSRALAAEQLAADKAKLNLEVLQRQAKGLQAEYQRATSTTAGTGSGATSDEASRLRSQIDGLIRQKDALQGIVDDAVAAKKSAEAKVEAISAQSKGLEREYDRLLAEHDKLRRNFEQATGGRAVPGGVSKKAE